MNEPAIVMSIKEGKAVILASGGRFLRVKDRNFHIGQRIILEPDLFFLSDRIGFAAEEGKEKLGRIVERLRYKGMIIIASLAILVPSSAYAATKYVPWTYVSVDSGAVSIQYQLNARGEVLSSETKSDEGKAVIDSVEPHRFEKIENVMDRTLTAIYPDKAVTSDERDPLMIGISTRFGNGERTLDLFSEAMEQKGPENITVERLNWADTGEAHSEDLSVGQYSLMRSLPENSEKNPVTSDGSQPPLQPNEDLKPGNTDHRSEDPGQQPEDVDNFLHDSETISPEIHPEEPVDRLKEPGSNQENEPEPPKESIDRQEPENSMESAISGQTAASEFGQDSTLQKPAEGEPAKPDNNDQQQNSFGFYPETGNQSIPQQQDSAYQDPGNTFHELSEPPAENSHDESHSEQGQHGVPPDNGRGTGDPGK